MNMNYLLGGREMCSMVFVLDTILRFYTRIDDVDDLLIVCTSDTILSYSVFERTVCSFLCVISVYSHLLICHYCHAYSHLLICQ